MCKASSLEEMLNVFKPMPLAEVNFDDFYVETSDARGDDAAFNIVFRLQQDNDLPKGILFMGHTGSGKSTELYKIKKELAQKYEVVNFSIKTETDINDLRYIDLIFAIMSNILSSAKKNRIPIDNRLFDNLVSYWNDERICEVTNTAKIDINASIEAKASFFDFISAKVKGIFQMGVESKDVVRKKIEPNIKQLITSINDIIRDIDIKLAKDNKKLLVIIEDLDKLDIPLAEELFVKNRKVVTSLNLNIIYTFPIFLFYSMYFNEIKDDFDDYVLLSMIKVKDKNSVPYVKGLETIREIVFKRADCSLIDSSALDFMIQKSGGALRNLFEMIENSIIRAKMSDKSATMIKLTDAQKAYARLKNSYERVTFKHQLQPLIEIYNDPLKKPIDNETVVKELLKTMSIIEYNGERWCGLNPAVEDFLKEKGLIV